MSSPTLLATINPADGEAAGADTITTSSGGDVVFGGGGGDRILAIDLVDGGSAADVVFGDYGFLEIGPGGTDRVWSSDDTFGGDDSIVTGAGSDLVLGGAGADEIGAGEGLNVVLGDHGRISASVDLTGVPSLTYVEAYAGGGVGGADHIFGGDGSDLVFGGVGGDVIEANGGRNLIFGDHGFLDAAEQRLWSSDESFGGDDAILTGSEDDTIVGGLGADFIDAGHGANVVIGDHARVTGLSLVRPTGRIEAFVPAGELGGADTIVTGVGSDVVFGGAGADVITSSVGETGTLVGAGDLVFGDYGYVDLSIEDSDPTDLDRVESLAPELGGDDDIITGQGNDIVIGGAGADLIRTDDGDDLVFGDNAALTSADQDVPLPDQVRFTPGWMSTTSSEIGGDDTIVSGTGGDIVFGGAGSDGIFTVAGNDLVFGDNGYLDFVVDDSDPADLDEARTLDPGTGTGRHDRERRR